ncbi:hypothetical protein HDU81_006020 [Chytriomyces hyalinus]|nr:hypothetical protein HDU81_006020 [Chytriomyces hyalinus]
MSSNINRENSIAILSNSVRMGQKMGAYLLREVSLLKKAIDFFNPEIKDKPDFGGSQDPEIVAVNLLLQGVQKAQSHGGEFSYSIDDAALLWDIMEFWMKEGGKAVAQNVNVSSSPKSDKESKSAKSAVNSARVAKISEEEEEEDDDNEIRVRPLSKGKERVV